MKNEEIQKPNFVLLKQLQNTGPISKVTLCKNTLNILEEKVISEIPKGWSVTDFYDLLAEGKRLFSPSNDYQIPEEVLYGKSY